MNHVNNREKSYKKYWLNGLPLMCCVFLVHCGGDQPEKKDEIMVEKTAPKNEPKNDIVTLPSGLRYKITKQTDGQLPRKGQRVSVHYSGYINPMANGKPSDEPGQKFDSSLDRGQPFEFVLGGGQVIRGWDEGIAYIPIGAEARLYIPANLGYGPRGAGAVIKPNSDLIFDVKVVAVY